MLSVKEYAEKHGVSTQSVYKMMQTHRIELDGHIVKQGKSRYLTDEAVEILESYRMASQVVVKQMEDQTKIEELKQQIAELQAKILSQSEDLVEAYKKLSDQSKLLGQIEERESYHQKQIIDLEIALDEEKNKSFFKRLFGK